MDATQMFLARHVRMHTRVDGLTEGLTDEQVRGHVHPAANPLAWLLWHMARAEDAAVNLLVAAGPQVLDATWARRLKVARRDIGEGMTMAEVDQLCETIDLGALQAYWAAVGERTAAVVSVLTPGALDTVISPKETRAGHRRRGNGFWPACLRHPRVVGRDDPRLLSRVPPAHPQLRAHRPGRPPPGTAGTARAVL